MDGEKMILQICHNVRPRPMPLGFFFSCVSCKKKTLFCEYVKSKFCFIILATIALLTLLFLWKLLKANYSTQKEEEKIAERVLHMLQTSENAKMPFGNICQTNTESKGNISSVKKCEIVREEITPIINQNVAMKGPRRDLEHTKDLNCSTSCDAQRNKSRCAHSSTKENRKLTAVLIQPLEKCIRGKESSESPEAVYEELRRDIEQKIVEIGETLNNIDKELANNQTEDIRDNSSMVLCSEEDHRKKVEDAIKNLEENLYKIDEKIQNFIRDEENHQKKHSTIKCKLNLEMKIKNIAASIRQLKDKAESVQVSLNTYEIPNDTLAKQLSSIEQMLQIVCEKLDAIANDKKQSIHNNKYFQDKLQKDLQRCLDKVDGDLSFIKTKVDPKNDEMRNIPIKNSEISMKNLEEEATVSSDFNDQINKINEKEETEFLENESDKIAQTVHEDKYTQHEDNIVKCPIISKKMEEEFETDLKTLLNKYFCDQHTNNVKKDDILDSYYEHGLKNHAYIETNNVKVCKENIKKINQLSRALEMCIKERKKLEETDKESIENTSHFTIIEKSLLASNSEEDINLTGSSNVVLFPKYEANEKTKPLSRIVEKTEDTLNHEYSDEKYQSEDDVEKKDDGENNNLRSDISEQNKNDLPIENVKSTKNETVPKETHVNNKNSTDWDSALKINAKVENNGEYNSEKVVPVITQESTNERSNIGIEEDSIDRFLNAEMIPKFKQDLKFFLKKYHANRYKNKDREQVKIEDSNDIFAKSDQNTNNKTNLNFDDDMKSEEQNKTGVSNMSIIRNDLTDKIRHKINSEVLDKSRKQDNKEKFLDSKKLIRSDTSSENGGKIMSNKKIKSEGNNHTEDTNVSITLNKNDLNDKIQRSSKSKVLNRHKENKRDLYDNVESKKTSEKQIKSKNQNKKEFLNHSKTIMGNDKKDIIKSKINSEEIMKSKFRNEINKGVYDNLYNNNKQGIAPEKQITSTNENEKKVLNYSKTIIKNNIEDTIKNSINSDEIMKSEFRKEIKKRVYEKQDNDTKAELKNEIETHLDDENSNTEPGKRLSLKRLIPDFGKIIPKKIRRKEHFKSSDHEIIIFDPSNDVSNISSSSKSSTSEEDKRKLNQIEKDLTKEIFKQFDDAS